MAIVSTHPIQYNAPLFRRLSDGGSLEPRVFYTWEGGARKRFDPGFGKEIEWDVPLLDGYGYQFVKNTSPHPSSASYSGITNPTLVREIEAWHSDAILVYGWKFRSHLAAIRHFHGKVPVLFRGDSHLLAERPGLHRAARHLVLKWVYSHIDHALIVGENNRAYFTRSGVPAERVTLAPHTVDNDFFDRDDSARREQAERIRQQLRIPETAVVLLFSGKLGEKKDPLLMIEAAARLPDELKTQLYILFVGDGELGAEIERRTESNPMLRRLPFQNQSVLPTYYRTGDIFCLPSRGPIETWGLSVNEAMACGLPAIVSDKVGCGPDLVRTGVTGFSFPAQDPESLAGVLSECVQLGRPGLRRLGQDAHKLVTTRFSIEIAATAMERAVLNTLRPTA